MTRARPQPWPDAAGALAVNLREQNASYAEIGAGLNKAGYRYTRAAVQGFLKRYVRNGGVIPPKQSPSWPPAADAMAKELWAKELPHGEVAASLSAKFGRAFSREAVSNRLARLGCVRSKAESLRLQRRNAIAVNEGRRAKAKPKPPTPIAPAVPRAPRVALAHDRLWRPLEGVTPKTILEVGHRDCRWPVSTEGEPLFCAAVAKAGSSWCPTHHACGHSKDQPSTKQEKKAA